MIHARRYAVLLFGPIALLATARGATAQSAADTVGAIRAAVQFRLAEPDYRHRTRIILEAIDGLALSRELRAGLAGELHAEWGHLHAASRCHHEKPPTEQAIICTMDRAVVVVRIGNLVMGRDSAAVTVSTYGSVSSGRRYMSLARLALAKRNGAWKVTRIEQMGAS